MKPLLLKTTEEKKLAKRLINHLMEEIAFLESFPKATGKKKEYFDGYIFGFKDAIVYLTLVIGDVNFTEEAKYLTNWEKGRKKMMGPKIAKEGEKIKS
jgi:hypothetical protein